MKEQQKLRIISDEELAQVIGGRRHNAYYTAGHYTAQFMKALAISYAIFG